MKKYVAELIGTFTLSLVVGLSVSGVFPIATPILAGLTLGLFVYTIGVISGCHINPAVTIGLLSIGKMEKPEAAKYIVAQLFGAFAAAVLLVQLNMNVPPIIAGGATQVFAEMIGTAILSFGVGAIVFGKVSDVASGLVIGGSLLLGISIAAMMGSAGILNPAVAFTLNAFHPTYLLGQVLGSLIGFSLARSLQK